MKKHDHLPIYGVGPIYGVTIMLLSLVGVLLSAFGIINFGKIAIINIPFMIIGIILLIIGILVWYKAAFRIDKYIKTNELCTDGIYAWVRNPCYSGIFMACTGVIFMTRNVVLLVLPIFYWLFMTILMKNTEEKWLYNLYGEPYLTYCKRVNRCIPWFPKKIV